MFSLSRARILTLGMAAAVALPGPLTANVLWSWQFSTESGTFVTDGSLADLAGPFTFTFLDFDVNASSIAGNIGAVYLVSSGGAQGFQWDGTQATQFFRNDGTLTNGSNFYRVSSVYYYTLATPPPEGILNDADPNNTDLTAPLSIEALQDLPVSVPGIPTLSGRAIWLLALLLAAVGVLVMRSVA